MEPIDRLKILSSQMDFEPAEDYGFAGAPVAAPEAEKAAPLPIPTAGVVYETLPDVDSGNARGNAAFADRLIIKNAEVTHTIT